jgi:hypothetical protein
MVAYVFRENLDKKLLFFRQDFPGVEVIRIGVETNI